jgi:hypothetical protein
MIQNVLIYLVTINLILTGLLYLLSRVLERYRESLDEFANYLYELQEEFRKKGDVDDGRTRTSDSDE